MDFVCFSSRLIVELDGGHHALQEHYDGRRDKFLRAQGFTILRFPDGIVLKETDVVLEVIWNALQKPITRRHARADIVRKSDPP